MKQFMTFLRHHWFDIGAVLGIIISVCLIACSADISPLHTLMWISLVTLFAHQFEEYRFPGTFPGMLNRVLFNSQSPDRYPLNMQSALVVNVVVGWGSYLLAALFIDQALWLGIGTVLVSLGNTVAHVTLFNIKGKTIYNPGMATSLALFVPVIYVFFDMILASGQASLLDWALGIGLGILLNVIGIIKVIVWMKDENTPYIFPERFLPNSN
jgi:hypothetical protein